MSALLSILWGSSEGNYTNAWWLDRLADIAAWLLLAGGETFLTSNGEYRFNVELPIKGGRPNVTLSMLNVHFSIICKRARMRGPLTHPVSHNSTKSVCASRTVAVSIYRGRDPSASRFV